MTRVSRVNRNNRRPPERDVPVVLLTSLSLVLLAAVAIYKFGFTSSSFDKFMPIRQVRVQGGLANLDPDSFKVALTPILQRSFFTLDLKELEKAVETTQWVESANVSRQWPDTVVIDLEEQQPVARWGKDNLLSERGAVFKKPSGLSNLSDLPVLSAPKGREKEVYDMMKVLNQMLSPKEEKVVSLSLSNRLAWTAELRGGLLIVFGSQDPISATVRAFTLLSQFGKERFSSMQKLDLRYPSGFAVTWKKDGQPQENASVADDAG